MLWPILAVVMTAAAVLGWVVAACRGADNRLLRRKLARYEGDRAVLHGTLAASLKLAELDEGE